MRLNVIWGVIGLLVCSLLLGCMSSVFTGATLFYQRKEVSHSLQNQYLGMQANNMLYRHQELFSGSHINVTSFNYDVLLVGQTPTAALKKQAETLIKNLAGIRRLFNLIEVKLSISQAQEIEDSWITTKIKSRIIANNDLNPSKFKVVTEDGVVYLLGDVEKDQAETVVDIARHTDGVIRVVRIFKYVGYVK